MAETAQLGKLVVQMILDPSKWGAGVKSVQESAKALVAGIQQAGAVVDRAFSPAMDDAAQGADTLGKAATDAAGALGDALGPALGDTADSADESAKAASRMAGVWMDVDGKLRDATGRFVKDADVLAALGDAANLTSEQLGLLRQRAEQIELAGARKSVQSFLGGLKELGDYAAGQLVTALKAAAVAAAGLATASAVVGVSFESQMKKVGVIAGATAEEMGALTDEARRLGATTSFSATEAAQAMEVLASAGLKTSDIIAATGQAMVLAGAGGTSLETSASIVASTLSQFSLAAGQAGRVADVFARATADSQFQVDDLGEALKYGGPTAASFGMSLEQAVAIMAQFRDLGLEGSMAGTALRSSLSQASQQTKVNSDTLAKYGLKLSDVNPLLHDFNTILETVGKAGISASDAMVVFGTEAGGAVATLAQQAALGSTKLTDMTRSLEEAATKGGDATKMYAEMQATVAGGLAELQSAGEEVLLTLYAQYGTELAGLLASITDFVNKVAVAIGERSQEIEGALGSALLTVGAYLDEHGTDLAKAFADGVVAVAEFAIGAANVATTLAGIIPLLDDIGAAMAVIWVAQKVAAFVSALEAMVTTLGTGRTALKAMMVELTAASGGTYALVAAIGVLVVGLGALIDRYLTAKDAATQLKDAQDALAGKRSQEDAARVAALDRILAKQQAGLAAQEQELAASGQLTAAKKAELDLLKDMTAESAARLEAEGKLVEVGGQLRTVASLVEEANTSATDEAVAGYQAIDQRVQALRSSAADAGKDFDALTKAVGQVKAMGDDASAATTAATLTGALGEEIKTLAEAEAKLEDLRRRRQDATKQAIALDTERGKAVGQILDREVQDTKAAEARKLAERGKAASTTMQQEKEYTDQTRDIRFKLGQELTQMEGALTDQIKLEFEQRRRDVQQQYADQIIKAKGNAAEIKRLEADLQGALTDLDELEARKRAERAAEIQRQHTKDVTDERKRLETKLLDMQEGALTESERLEKEKAQAIAGISGANADLSIKIAEEYNKKIAAAQQREADAAKARAEEAAKYQRDLVKGVAQSMVRAFTTAASIIGDALSSLYEVFSSFASRVYDVFATLTGFSFDLAGAVSDAQSAQSTAADEGTTLSAAEAAQQTMDGLFSDALAFLAFFEEAAPTIMEALAAGVPTLIDAFLASVPAIASAVLEQVPAIVEAIAAALPGLVSVITGLLPAVVSTVLEALDVIAPALTDALPGLLSGLVSAAADLVTAVVARLPDIVQGFLDLLPTLIRGVLAELPAIVRALLSAATDVVVALVKALPDLVSAILEALPDILTALIEGLVEALPVLVEALVEAIPDLLVAIIDAVPDIVLALVNELPTIITALIGLIPTLIEGIVQALPVLIPALVGLAGEVFAGLVQAAPEIAVALVKALAGLITDLPDLALAIGQAFVDAITGAFDAIVDALAGVFEAAWDALTSLFDGGDSTSRKSRSAASSARTVADMTGLVEPRGVNRSADFERARAAQDTAQRPAAGSLGQTVTTQVNVLLNGRAVQEALIQSDARGQTDARARRRSGGSRVGIDRGSFNRYSK